MDETTTLAIRGDDDTALRDAVGAVGATVTDVDDADVLLAVGEGALLSLADAPVSVPVLPVDAAAGPHGVERDDLPATLRALARGDCRTHRHPLLSATVDGQPIGRAATDVTVLTSRPVRISEFSIQFEDAAHSVDSLRADGVVVATPLGSSGYARAVGGPIAAAGTGLVVAPLAPFSTRADVWVAPAGVTIAVERDETPVSLVLDDTVCRAITPETPVVVTPEGRIDIVAPVR